MYVIDVLLLGLPVYFFLVALAFALAASLALLAIANLLLLILSCDSYSRCCAWADSPMARKAGRIAATDSTMNAQMKSTGVYSDATEPNSILMFEERRWR
jgi:hypothetical protein